MITIVSLTLSPAEINFTYTNYSGAVSVNNSTPKETQTIPKATVMTPNDTTGGLDKEVHERLNLTERGSKA